jgi:hypothetical protein
VRKNTMEDPDGIGIVLGFIPRYATKHGRFHFSTMLDEICSRSSGDTSNPITTKIRMRYTVRCGLPTWVTQAAKEKPSTLKTN